jgi:hypothetical protein
MGMYDTIECSDEVPYNDEMLSLGLSARNWSFQTKDLDCSLSVYVLQSGILLEKKYKESKWIEPTTKKKDRWNFGHMEYFGPYVENTKHHGKIRMHDYRQGVLDKWDCWIEYEVTFTDGEVTNTELVKFRKNDNTERVARWKELTDRIEAEHNKWSNRFFFHTKPVLYIKRLIHEALHRIGNGILSLSYKI